ILTDGALLKRQQLEIEELRKKLQGSHAGVLEQEVLKLRNDLLKYEMERGKLEMELEEERKSRNQWISTLHKK
ncbi:centromerE-associated protein E-like, partial [Trifolium medium]|nr:centromerE-associated protein E-like [Trifolium medium]